MNKNKISFEDNQPEEDRPLDYGIMSKKANRHPFVEQKSIEVLQNSSSPEKLVEINYGKGKVQGTLAKDFVCLTDDYSLCVDGL